MDSRRRDGLGHLVTRDAHGLYARFGWRVTPEPEMHMEIVVRDAYR